MSALDILIERILANANPSNMFWLKDNAVAATCELAQLRAHAYVWAGADPFTGEQVVNLLNENDKLRASLAAAQKRVEEAKPIIIAALKADRLTTLMFGDDTKKATAWLEEFKETPS